MRRMTTVLAILAAVGCNTERFPTSPQAFGADLTTPATTEKMRVGNTIVVDVRATDQLGRTIQDLKFHWASADTTVVVVSPTADGHSAMVHAKAVGVVPVVATLPDGRFDSRPDTVVVTVVP